MQIRLFRQRKGEFYIISALIMIAIISGLSAKANVAFTAPSPVKFYDLSDNFEKEGYKIIDTYVFQGSREEIATQIDNFTTNFLQYAREKDPNVGLVYIYGNETNVLVSNHAFTEINSTTSSAETARIQSPDITSLSNITINVSGKAMTRDVAQRAALFNVLSTSFTRKSETKWVVINIAGALYPFNTADDKNFYVVVTTRTPTKEDVFTGSESVPKTCSELDGITCTTTGFACTFLITSASNPPCCKADECKDCKTIDATQYSDCTCAAMGYTVKEKDCTDNNLFCLSPLSAYQETCCRNGCGD